LNIITGHMDAGIVVAAVNNPAQKRDGSFCRDFHMFEPRARKRAPGNDVPQHLIHLSISSNRLNLCLVLYLFLCSVLGHF